MGILKEYLSKVYHEQDDPGLKKRISIEVRDWTVDDTGEPINVVSKRIEGNDMSEFRNDFEKKFGKKMSPDMQAAFVKMFQAAIGRAKEAGTTDAEVDAAVLPKGMSGEKWAQRTGRGITKH